MQVQVPKDWSPDAGQVKIDPLLPQPPPRFVKDLTKPLWSNWQLFGLSIKHQWGYIWPFKCDGRALSWVRWGTLGMESNLLIYLATIIVALSTLATLIALVAAGGVGLCKPRCNLRGGVGNHQHQGQEDQVHCGERLRSLLQFLRFPVSVSSVDPSPASTGSQGAAI